MLVLLFLSSRAIEIRLHINGTSAHDHDIGDFRRCLWQFMETSPDKCISV